MQLPRVVQKALYETWEFSSVAFVWYATLAGALWLAFYVLFRQAMRIRKINPRPPARGQVAWEIRYSLMSLFLFGLVSGTVVLIRPLGVRTRLYHPMDLHGWTWYYVSILAAIFLHDAYFYATHRLMHHPRLFRPIHRTHHLSNNPTPWAAYSFSVGEALIQALIGPIVVYTVPMHFSAFLLFMTWQISFNVLGHCGYEIYPRWFLKTWIGRFLNTPTHHAMHHEKVGANFGLYFTIWDQVFGTTHPGYEHRFAAATDGRSAEPSLEA
jgi:Delta7-sterol 5-desaturase